MNAASGCDPEAVAVSKMPLLRSKIQRADATAASSARIRRKLRGYLSVNEGNLRSQPHFEN